MRHLISQTTSEAYLKALEEVWFQPDYYCAPRGQPIREVLDYSFSIRQPNSEPIVTHDEERNKIIASYTEKEKELYDSGSNLVEDFGKASKFWHQLVNPDNKTINSAYGHLIWANKSHGNPWFERTEDCMRTPWEWCKQSLIQDKDTRQAILRFSLPEHQWIGNKDQVCTMYGNFLIRENKLNLSVFMRSNDLMRGLVYDLPWFVSLMDKMIEELRPTYPDLQKGIYTHCSNSMHIYEKDRLSIFKMLNIKE